MSFHLKHSFICFESCCISLVVILRYENYMFGLYQRWIYSTIYKTNSVIGYDCHPMLNNSKILIELDKGDVRL